jgi:hypothetical protein
LSGFSADWLALREPFDTAARSSPLVESLAARLAPAGGAPLEIVDLGAGAASNFRYLAPRLPFAQRWRLVDHDAALLDAASTAIRGWAAARGASCAARGATLEVRGAGLECDVLCERRDLRDLGAVALPARGLVTAAALLDLVSQDWLTTLAARCSAARASVCFALTYDGRSSSRPSEPEDDELLALFNRHQRGDKGFGPALGPEAPAATAAAYARLGYTVETSQSDWRFAPEDATIQRALLDGWVTAALEIEPARRAALSAWHARRLEHVAAARSTLAVGHVDLVGWLP